MIVLDIPIPPPANNLFFNRRLGRARSSAYKSWLYDAGMMLLAQKPPKLRGQVSILIEVEDSDNRRTDADGRAKAPLDLLVAHQVIEDDSKKIVRKVAVEWNKDIRGARVTITPVEG